MLLGIRWKNLRTKIIAWSFTPTAIILLAVALFNFYAYQRVTEDLVIHRDRELTRLLASQLMMDLGQYTDELTVLARTPDIYAGDSTAQQSVLKQNRNRLAVFDGGVVVLNNHGEVVATEPARPDILGQDWSDRAYFRQVLRSQMRRSPKPTFSDIVADGPGGSEVIAAAVPIVGSHGEFRGVMAGLFRLSATTTSALYGTIVKLRVGRSGHTYLVDSNGRLIYHFNTDRIGDDCSEQAEVQQVLKGEVGAHRTRDPNGQDIVAGFAPVPGTSWGLVTEEDWAVLTSGSRGYQQFLIFLLVLGVVVPALVVTVGVRRITEPIEDLIEAAQEVAKGNFGQTITARTGDEIEELAEQFNHMSVQLQESYAQLEQRVADRTKELATLNAVITTANRSLDLEEVLSVALDKTLQLMGMEAGGIYLLDEEAGMLTLAEHQGFSPDFIQEIGRLRVGEGFLGRVAQSGQPLVVGDVSTDPRLTRVIAREEGFHALVSVPLSSKGKVLGTLYGATRGYREFTDQDVQLLTSIGRQIGVAVENAQLYEAEQRRAEEAETLREAGAAVVATLEQSEAIERILEQLERVVPYDSASVQLLRDGYLEIAGGRGWSDLAVVEGMRFPVPGDNPNTVVIQRRRPYILNDAPAAHSPFREDPHSHIQSWLGVPLTFRDRVIGMLAVDSAQPRHFTPDHARLASAFADQVAIAIEHARLYEQAQHDAETRALLLRELDHRVKNNLATIAGLLRMELGCQRTSREESLITVLNRVESIVAVHEHLSGQANGLISLQALVTHVIRGVCCQMASSEQAITVKVDAEEVLVGSRQGTTLALVLNELATNSLKHAFAGRRKGQIRSQVSQQNGEVVLAYRDDGPGLPEDFDLHHSQGVGMGLIASLVEKLPGRLHIDGEAQFSATIHFEPEDAVV